VPQAQATGEDQHRQRQVQSGAGEVGTDHDPPPGQVVVPHPAEEHQQRERRCLRRQHQAQVARRSGAAGDEQRQRHDRDLIADQGRGRQRKPPKRRTSKR
jgi:hypothetical protein